MKTEAFSGLPEGGPHSGLVGLRSRLRAAGIHLGLSAAVAGLFAAIVLVGTQGARVVGYLPFGGGQ